MAPGPTPIFTQSAPAAMSSSVPSAVTTLPAITCTRWRAFTFSTIRVTPAEWPCAMSTTMTSTPAPTRAAARSSASPATRTAAPTRTSASLARRTSSICSATVKLRWITPRPRRRPSAIAMVASVTVSMAAERIGMSRRISFVRRASVETWVGRMSLRAGIRRTSSKVRPSLANFSSRFNPPASPAQVYRLRTLSRALLREGLRERGAAARPRLERLDAPPAPRACAPREHERGRQADQAGAGEKDRLQIPEEVEVVGDDGELEEHEHLHLQEEQEEHERERGGSECPPNPVGKRDIEQVHRGDPR